MALPPWRRRPAAAAAAATAPPPQPRHPAPCRAPSSCPACCSACRLPRSLQPLRLHRAARRRRCWPHGRRWPAWLRRWCALTLAAMQGSCHRPSSCPGEGAGGARQGHAAQHACMGESPSAGCSRPCSTAPPACGKNRRAPRSAHAPHLLPGGLRLALPLLLSLLSQQLLGQCVGCLGVLAAAGARPLVRLLLATLQLAALQLAAQPLRLLICPRLQVGRAWRGGVHGEQGAAPAGLAPRQRSPQQPALLPRKHAPCASPSRRSAWCGRPRRPERSPP